MKDCHAGYNESNVFYYYLKPNDSFQCVLFYEDHSDNYMSVDPEEYCCGTQIHFLAKSSAYDIILVTIW